MAISVEERRRWMATLDKLSERLHDRPEGLTASDLGKGDIALLEEIANTMMEEAQVVFHACADRPFLWLGMAYMAACDARSVVANVDSDIDRASLEALTLLGATMATKCLLCQAKEEADDDED